MILQLKSFKINATISIVSIFFTFNKINFLECKYKPLATLDSKKIKNIKTKNFFFFVDNDKDIIEAQGLIYLQLKLYPDTNTYIITGDGEAKRIAGYLVNPLFAPIIDIDNVSSYVNLFRNHKPTHIIAIRKALNLNLIAAAQFCSIPLSCISKELNTLKAINQPLTPGILFFKNYYQTIYQVCCETQEAFKEFQKYNAFLKNKPALYGSLRMCNVLGVVNQTKENLNIKENIIPIQKKLINMSIDNPQAISKIIESFVFLKKKIPDLRIIISAQTSNSVINYIKKILKKYNLQHFDWNYKNTIKLSASAYDLPVFFAKIDHILDNVDCIINSVQFTDFFWKVMSHVFIINYFDYENKKHDLSIMSLMHKHSILLNPENIYCSYIFNKLNTAHHYKEKKSLEENINSIFSIPNFKENNLSKNFLLSSESAYKITSQYINFLKDANQEIDLRPERYIF